jgi:hypothetical protein
MIGEHMFLVQDAFLEDGGFIPPQQFFVKATPPNIHSNYNNCQIYQP